MKSLVAISTGLLLLAPSSCTTLSRGEKEKLAELRSLGVREHETVKHPAVAGALNLLPGCGNFYLAVGADEGDHWLYGFLNLLTWPLSIFWGVPEAAIDASNINDRQMIYYFMYDPAGKAEFEALKAHHSVAPAK